LFASINISGPGEVIANDIKFPAGITPVYPEHKIATLGVNGALKMIIGIQFIDPLKNIRRQNLLKNGISNKLSSGRGSNKLLVNINPNPVKQVNYGICQLEGRFGEEYISLEIWTDGSITPNLSLEYALERLTQMFYTFTTLQKV